MDTPIIDSDAGPLGAPLARRMVARPSVPVRPQRTRRPSWKARDRLLGSLGMKAPPPKEPNFAPAGVKVVYRKVSGGGAKSIGEMRRLGG